MRARPAKSRSSAGINLNNESVVSPGHHAGRDHGHTHDVYVELIGPSASDVHHNFVQRWNEASERHASRRLLAGRAARGRSRVSAARIARRRVGNGASATHRARRPLHGRHGGAGRRAIPRSQAARRRSSSNIKRRSPPRRSSIYLENQALGCPQTVEALHGALRRGVEVVVLTPADANIFMTAARKDARSKPFFDRFDALGEHERFTLAGIASPGPAGKLRNIYVHAKAAIIDDGWATIGSCNIGARSFFGDTEMNVTFWAPDVARQLRVDLLREHLGDGYGEPRRPRGVRALSRARAR